MALLIQRFVIPPRLLTLPLGWDNYLNASRAGGLYYPVHVIPSISKQDPYRQTLN
jgi:hypothetical protein